MPCRRAAGVACALALGCSPWPTTLLIDIDAVPGVTATSLTLHVALPGDAGVSAPLPASGAAPQLPGQVVVKLADEAIDVDLSLDGLDAGGAMVHAGRTVHIVPHQQTRTSLTLAVDMPPGCTLGARCVYAHRRVLTISNGSGTALPVGYAVRVPIDAAVLPASEVRADLADVRLFGDAPDDEHPRVIDLAPPGQTRALWFALARPIASNASDSSYGIYYGDPGASAAPSDASQVFALWDGFDNGTQLSSFWLTNGGPTVGSGTLTLRQNTQDALTTNASLDTVPTLSALEWRSRVTNPGSGGQITAAGTFWYWIGYQRLGDFTAADPWAIWISRGANEEHGERKVVSGGTSCTSGCSGPAVGSDTAFHVFRVERGPASTRFYRDGVLSYEVGDPNVTDYSVMIRNFALTSDLIVDWIRARPLASPEPTVMVGPELPVP